MHINLEDQSPHSVQAYSDHSITIQAIEYNASLIVCSSGIIHPWTIHRIGSIDEKTIMLLESEKPEIFLIGHQILNERPPLPFLKQMETLRIGFESISIGAACRTYNILLAEGRKVALGIIF